MPAKRYTRKCIHCGKEKTVQTWVKVTDEEWLCPACVGPYIERIRGALAKAAEKLKQKPVVTHLDK